MTSDQLIARFTQLGCGILKFSDHFPRIISLQTVARQVSRSASSCGANYRAACRSKSPRDFINKLKIVEEELDETEYWLDVLLNLEYGKKSELLWFKQEVNELLSITVRSITTAKRNLQSNETNSRPPCK